MLLESNALEFRVTFVFLSAIHSIGALRRAFLVAQVVKNPPAMWETWVRSELRRSPGEGKGYPLQYSGLENSMDCIVHRVAKSQTRLSNCHFHFQGALRGPENLVLFRVVQKPPSKEEVKM